MLTFLIVLYVIIAVIMVLLILVQSSKAAGMGLFGGSSTDSVLGSGGAEILTKITAVFAVLFVLFAFGISYTVSKSKSKLDKVLKQEIQIQQKQQQAQENKTPSAALPDLPSASNK